MGIMSRVVRLCKADLHGVMDQMEDKELLLKQHLREMKAAMADRQARMEALADVLRAGQRERLLAEKQRQALEEDLDRAVARDRDDIARMLIRKLLPVRKRLATIAGRLEATTQRLDEERDRLGAQRRAYDEIRQRVAAARDRARSAALMPDRAATEAGEHRWSPSNEEVEWELLQRKDNLCTGRAT